MVDSYWPDGTPISPDDPDTPFRFKAPENAYAWRVGSTWIGPYWVSTVWLPIDYGFIEGDKGTIRIFETMIFGMEEYEVLGRYSSWYAALTSHLRIVAILRARYELPPDPYSKYPCCEHCGSTYLCAEENRGKGHPRPCPICEEG